jgi:3,4-dihydroxy 2-butanone 4-phosphate synthase/GTP cyclohydrolase II
MQLTAFNAHTVLSTIKEAIKDIKNGKPVIVVDDEDRENEGDLIVAAEKVTPAIINFMAREARGLICTPVSKEIAGKLDFYPMVSENEESEQCNFAVSVDLRKDITSGISAADRAKTIQQIVNSKAKASDFVRPGHVFPLRARDGGVLVRAGHTEAAVDLARLAGLKPAGTICEIMKEDGTMARLPDLVKFGRKHKLKIISIADLIAYRRGEEKLVRRVAEARLPTEYGEFQMVVYESLIEPGKEHVALVKGSVKGKKNVLVRVHSECLTGDAFHSLRCDCNDQKEEAMRRLEKAGAGVLVYMRQEGRGIGLANKIKAYGLQDRGADTVEANERLGFKADLREYGIGAQILADLGLTTIHLLTNNPKKLAGLAGYGLRVTKRLAIESKPGRHNRDYLATKKNKLGHALKQV